MAIFCAEGAPGTGKTTLAFKIYKQAEEEGLSVCYETFRRNMAQDFIRRIGHRDYWVGTTHSICFRLLKLEYHYTLKNVADSEVWDEFCRKVGIPVDPTELKKDITHIDELTTPGAKIYTIYSNCVNTMTSFDDWDELPPRMKPNLEPKYVYMVTEVIDKWISYLERENLIDFPMMLMKAFELKLTPPTDIYIADEFQDKTPIQYELFKLWSKDKHSVVVLGDVSQCIYSFWGTSPKFFYEVRRRSKFKVLSPSWRLSKQVYDCACQLLRMSNQEVFDVDCVGKTTLMEIDFHRVFDVLKECRNVMLITRTNYHLYIIANHLRNYGIPFVGRFGWTEKQYVLYKFIWKYRNKIEPIYKSELLEYLKASNAYPPSTLKFIKISLQNELRIQDVDNYLPNYHKVVLNSSADPFKLLNLDEKQLNDMRTAFKNNHPPRTDILLTTIHGAKGLEADVVIVFDGITKRIMQTMMQDHEEYLNEYRVWFVALTRVKKTCFVVRYAPIKYSMPFLPRLN